MTPLRLVVTPTRMVHLPTEIDTMRFTPANRWALYEWLAADLGRDHFEMTENHLVIETTQGDSRYASLGCSVIKRPTRRDHEWYPVEHEVIEDGYKPVPA